MAGMFALGYLLQRLVINRASHGKDENILLVTLGLSIVLENLALVWFKSDTRSIDTPYALSTVEIGPALIALPKLIAFGGALAVAACLLWLIRGTDLGRAIRAVAREKQGARLMGIDVERVYALSFGIGMACLGAAACFLLPAYYVNPQVGGGFVLVAFTIVVLGGMGSFAGALAGGLLIGVVESLGGLFLGDSLGQMGIFAIFILVLLFRFAGAVRGKHEHERQGRLRHPGLRPGGAGHHRVHAVGRAADLHHDVAVRGAAVAGLEHPGRLRRPAVLRPCAVLRRGRLCPARWASCRWAGILAGLALCDRAGHGGGLAVGGLTFRYGLRGSYFALVTLAFAEVLRIVATSVSFTGGGVGLMLPLREVATNMQFPSRHGYIYLILAFVLLALAVTAWLRRSRFGAYLQAVRDNEDAARAIGVDPLRVKLGGIALSAAFMSAAGAFYVQVFQYIDPAIAFGPAVSVEALVGAIVGGMGTLWGRCWRAGAARAGRPDAQPVRRAARHQHGDLRRGADPDRDLRAARHQRLRPVGGAAVRAACAARWRNDMLLQAQALSISFGGLKAVQDVSLAVPAGSISALVGPNGAGKTTLFGLLSGFLRPDQGKVLFDGRDITGMAPQRAARLGMARTFQIVQPFGAQTVRENIAVGAHLRLPGRADALAAAEAIARRVNLGAQLDKPAADLTVCGRKRLELARAGHPAPVAVAGRGAGGAEPGRDRRDDSRGAPAGGGWRDRADDRARDARGHEPGRAGLGAGAGPAHRPGHAGAGDARRRWWKPTWGIAAARLAGQGGAGRAEEGR